MSSIALRNDLPVLRLECSDFFKASKMFLHPRRVVELVKQRVQEYCLHSALALIRQTLAHLRKPCVIDQAKKVEVGGKFHPCALHYIQARAKFLRIVGAHNPLNLRRGHRRGGSGASPVLHPHVVEPCRLPSKPEVAA